MSLDHVRRGSGRRGLAAGALGLALLLVPLVLPAAPTPDERAKLSRRSAALWAAGEERFRAVLHLAAGSETFIPLAPRGLAQPKQRLDAVAEVQAHVLSVLAERAQPTDVQVRHRYRLRPSVAVDLSRRGLEAALSMPEVVWVEEAELWLAHTAEGLPLVGADALHAAGVTGEGQAIAIVDTGVDFLHPALGAGAIPNSVVVYGLDTADNDTNARDCGTHGTAVASVAAGRPHVWASLTRFAGGVAPAASILAYKASRDDACGTFDSRDVVAALEDAVLRRDEYNLVAVNLSLGGEPSAGPCDGDGAMSSYVAAIEDATSAGLAVVVSSGNGASGSTLDSPACVSGAISVASVYDGPVGPLAFCGSGAAGTCTAYLCHEPGGVADAVPCYANTNRYLDLFAPSEILTAAERSGTVMEFGGTSGAAPYVTGAIALLHQALPGMDPVRARFLLGLTGRPVTDLDNDLTRPRLDLAAALAADGIAVGQAAVPIPAELGVPALSTASVDAQGFVESVEVTVKILHGRPRQLVVTLEAPDGTRVRLHDRGAGTTSEVTADYLAGATGVWATYPTETAPAQSLELFSDLRAAGTWTLEVVDLDPAPAPGASPRIVGWGLHVTTSPLRRPPQLTAGSLVIPVAARASGTGGTFWVTDTRLLNGSTSSEAAVRLYLVPQGEDGTTSFHMATVAVPPRTVLDLPDVVGGLLGVDQVQGNLLLVTESPHLDATSRTYNTGGGAGTFGQYVPARAPGSAAAAAGEPPVMLLQLASGPASRTNVGLSEISGSAVTVTATLVEGATGAVLGTTTLTVPPWSNLQVNDVFAALGAPPSDNAYATVEATAGAGRAFAYASVVDRSTGDAIFVPGSRPVAGSSWLLPIVARAPGSQGTNWVSDLRVFNGSDVAVDVHLELRPEASRGGSTLQTVVSVEPGRVLALDDAAGLLVPSGSVTGSLRLSPTPGETPLLVTSRTYNRTDEGTFGQYVPAVGPGSRAGTAVSLIHIDGGDGFRTNLGLCEARGGSVSLRYVLRDASGSTLGVGTAELGPYEVRQVNDLHASLGVSDGHNTRVDVYQDGGEGAFAAYASVVDNLSGDAVFIPSY